MKRLATTALAIGLLAIPISTSAAASTPTTFAFHGTLTGTVKPTGINCLTPHGCEIYVAGHGTWTGDFTGTDTFTATVYQQPNGVWAYLSQTAVLSGLVKNCGSGTAPASVSGSLTGLQFPPPGATATSTWKILPGGTGQLATASGGGTETDFFGADGHIIDHARGTITCQTN